MGANGTVFTIVGRLAEATASTEWCIETLPTPRVPEPQPVEVHPALDLIRKPNAFMSGRDLIESVQQHVDLTGEGYLVVNRGARTALPVELWPVRPDRMSPVPGTDGVFLAGWIYTGPDGERVPLDVQDVLQIKLPNPLDPYRGLGPIQSVLIDIDASRMAAEWNRNFFLNSAQPGGIIEVEEGLSDIEWRQMVSRWREQHQGVAQAHRVAILEKGKWVDRNYTLKDMQFTELRMIPREIIREAFGFPKAMLGAVDDVNRANAEAGEYVFTRWAIVPRLERVRSVLNARLLPMYGPLGDGVQFGYDSPVPGDKLADNAELTAKVNAYVALTVSGVSPQSASDVTGLPPMEHDHPPQPVVPDGTPVPGGDQVEQDGDQADEDQGVTDTGGSGK
jgi:HK97 family phage portal protein